MRQTIFRQTMFAEFEKLAHASAESGEPLTLDRIKELYHSRLKLYFGPDFTLDPELDLECLRIPHFYRTFYVYKYATAMSAAIALVDRVTGGGREGTERLSRRSSKAAARRIRSICCAAPASISKSRAASTARWCASTSWSRNWTRSFSKRSPPMVFRRDEVLKATEDVLSDEGLREQDSSDLENV